MSEANVLNYIEQVLENIPNDWLNLTTHRLDIYREELAKTEFIEEFDQLFHKGNSELTALNELPTAYDYIRLGHPLSSVLEWTFAKIKGFNTDEVISFSSMTAPILAVLRYNLFAQKKTLIAYSDELPKGFDIEILKSVYNYTFDLQKVEHTSEISDYDGSIIYFSIGDEINFNSLNNSIDFYISAFDGLGSLIFVNGESNRKYISEIQHVRRRETIAMTPQNCHLALKRLIGQSAEGYAFDQGSKEKVLSTIKTITQTNAPALIGSSGLSIQYAIMMGLIDHALEENPGKAIKIIVPPNCYGGTNDQARRVAACSDLVSIVDLPVDGENDMVSSTEKVLEAVALTDAVPLIIAEIPTNPRVEVPNLEALSLALSKERKTENGNTAVKPIFILDQTFCPNYQFLKADSILSSVASIAYVSGSKFPSGGRCTAGYCVANSMAESLLPKIDLHLTLCDNAATPLQLDILAEQMPSMLQRIDKAYHNTKSFVDYIATELPEAKINFVSTSLADQGFTPSVFSLDLPTKGNSHEEKEAYKRQLNNKLINMMITQIPNESKYCVSYGQLKGCYWTIPATSTQGTTKESDKDYIARVSVSPDLDLEKHKSVFTQFVSEIQD